MLENKRIMFVINGLNRGGAAKIMTWLSNESMDIFAEVFIVSFKKINEDTRKSIKRKITLIEIKQNKKRGLFSRISKIKGLKKIINSINPDLICSFVSDVNVTTYFSMKGLKTPYILSDHGNPKALNWIWRVLTKRAYSKANLSIFLTEDTKAFYNANKNGIVIENPYLNADIDAYDGEREKIICSAGRFVPEKNFELLIDAFIEMSDKYPEYKLIIYGDGTCRKKLENKVKKHNMEDRIYLPGFVDNVPLKIRKNKVFVLSSNNEGFPVTLVEAMGVGVPTVSTDCGGAKEITDNGKRGILVKIKDKKALINGIEKILSDDSISLKLSKKGLEVKEILNDKIILNRWENAFIAVLQNKIN